MGYVRSTPEALHANPQLRTQSKAPGSQHSSSPASSRPRVSSSLPPSLPSSSRPGSVNVIILVISCRTRTETNDYGHDDENNPQATGVRAWRKFYQMHKWIAMMLTI